MSQAACISAVVPHEHTVTEPANNHSEIKELTTVTDKKYYTDEYLLQKQKASFLRRRSS